VFDCYHTALWLRFGEVPNTNITTIADRNEYTHRNTQSGDEGGQLPPTRAWWNSSVQDTILRSRAASTVSSIGGGELPAKPRELAVGQALSPR
jgi:hypothetical protein